MIKIIKKISGFFAVIFSILGIAQTPISLEEAYDRALKNNLTLKNGELRVSAQEKLKKSHLVIDPLNISAEYGQMNSVYSDNRVSASQVIRLPKFYNTQKTVLLEEWKNQLLMLDVQKWQLKKQLGLVYNQLKYIDEKKQLLQKADSIYAQYFKGADLRLKKGESNILEKATAENLRSQAELQLKALERDKQIALYQFNFLINEGFVYTNEKSKYNIMQLEGNHSEYKGNPIVLKQLEQEKIIQIARLEAEKAKIAPYFSIGYNNMSMYGNGADNNFYERSKRFQSGSIGVGIPIFNTAQKAIIENQKINQLIAENNYQMGVYSLKNEYAKFYGEYQKLMNEVDYYKTKGLQNSELIISTANRQFYEGEINYLEWTMLINQALDIQNKNIDALKRLNDQVIELNALSSGELR